MGTRKYRLSEAVLTSTHDLCFRAKIRKNVYPCKPQFYYIKAGCKGVYITRACYPDDLFDLRHRLFQKKCYSDNDNAIGSVLLYKYYRRPSKEVKEMKLEQEKL